MNLKRFDNKCIRLEDIFGDIYEGICQYNDREYNYHEYGEDEESLDLSNIFFYKSIIKKVTILKDGFKDKYGKLEEVVIESGTDLIEEVFEGEENISIYRLLFCIEDKIHSFKEKEKEELKKLLDTLIKYNDDDKIIIEAKKIKEIL